jgi:hypothetical protein
LLKDKFALLNSLAWCITYKTFLIINVVVRLLNFMPFSSHLRYAIRIDFKTKWYFSPTRNPLYKIFDMKKLVPSNFELFEARFQIFFIFLKPTVLALTTSN